MRKSHVFIAGLCILAIVLIVRLIWVAARTECGWTLLKQHWLDATVGLVFRRTVPIYMQEPADQADFWLKEAKRITDADPQNAELAMGAAIVLDSPGMEFEFRYITKTLDVPPLGRVVPQFDRDGVAAAAERFEAKCSEQCLAMAARATGLQPAELRWWRMRAVLQTPDRTNSSRETPRHIDWLDTIEECKNHDHHNSLYDYLAAEFLLHISTETNYSKDKTEITITDEEKYALANRYFQRGQDCGKCVVEDVGSQAVDAFLQKTSISCFDQSQIARHNVIHNRIFGLLHGLWRDLSDQCESDEQNDDFRKSLVVLLQTSRLLDQFCGPGGACAVDPMPKVHAESTLITLDALAAKHPELMDSEGVADAKASLANFKLDWHISKKASARMAGKRKIGPSQQLISTAVDLVIAAANSTIVPALLLGACSLAIGLYVVGSVEKPPGVLGFWRHILIWFSAYAVSFVALGMTASEIIPPAAQKWIAISLLAILLAAMTIRVLWTRVYHRKPQYSVRTLLCLTFIVAVSCAAISACDFHLSSLDRINLAVPSRESMGVNAELLADQIINNFGIWIWALWQWIEYQGPLVSVGIALALLVCWYQIRFRKIVSPSQENSRVRLKGLLVSVGRSMIVVAVGWLIVYLCITPSLIQSMEDDYQEKMSYIRNPRKYHDVITAAMDEVRADKDFMKAIENELRNAPATQPATTP
jgi:hypothetical protein